MKKLSKKKEVCHCGYTGRIPEKYKHLNIGFCVHSGHRDYCPIFKQELSVIKKYLKHLTL